MKKTWYAFTVVHGVVAKELPNNMVQVMGVILKQLMSQRREPGGEKTFKMGLDTWATLWIVDADKLDPKQARKYIRGGKHFKDCPEALKGVIAIRRHHQSKKLFAQQVQRGKKA